MKTAYADWVTSSRVDVIYVTRHEFVDRKSPMYIRCKCGTLEKMVINSITKVPVMKFVLLMVLHYVIMNTIATNHGSSGLSPMPVP